MPEDNPCLSCDAKCCRYFAVEIDRPTRKSDFDCIRWFLCHEKTKVFVDEGKWFLEIQNRCRHLAADERCAIYTYRPDVCRNHTTDDCEGVLGSDFQHDHEFESDAELDLHVQQLRQRRRPRGAKSRKK